MGKDYQSVLDMVRDTRGQKAAEKLPDGLDLEELPGVYVCEGGRVDEAEEEDCARSKAVEEAPEGVGLRG